MRSGSLRRRRERGGILGALLVTGVVIICLLIAGGIVIGRNVHITTTERSNGNDDVSIDLPGGHLDIHAHDKASAAVTDIPIYPGARSTKNNGGGAVIQWSSDNGRNDKGFAVSASESVTSDPIDKVVDYYRAQLPNWIIAKRNDSHVEFELRNGGYKRIVGIHEESDGTHIGVASVGEPASN